MGKYEIKIQINNTQKKINKNNSLIDDYYNALSETSRLISNLKMAKNSLSLTDQHLENSFTVSGKAVKSDELQILIQNVSSMIKNLEGNVISAMKEKIKKLNADNQSLRNKLANLKVMYNKEK